jgi:2-hydroxychromene-2-carboxylate isomerase
MAVVAFYFDCADPAAVLAAVRLGEAALRTGSSIDWQPVLGSDLPAAPAAAAAELAYAAKDLADWARFTGLRLAARRPAADLATAVAGFLATLPDPRVRGRAAEAWLRSAHVAGEPDLVAVAAAAGTTPADVVAAGAAAGARQRVAANADRLVALGGFRTPAFAVGTDLYLGNERIALVELALTQASDYRLVPPGAHSQRAAAGPGDP